MFAFSFYSKHTQKNFTPFEPHTKQTQWWCERRGISFKAQSHRGVQWVCAFWAFVRGLNGNDESVWMHSACVCASTCVNENAVCVYASVTMPCGISGWMVDYVERREVRKRKRQDSGWERQTISPPAHFLFWTDQPSRQLHSKRQQKRDQLVRRPVSLSLTGMSI